jgi:EAL domain-containing protein (putative c-di-GMP-specific phosphodiesterase class I)/signal transduction histidine kinase/CheY-like chemotaxis protein
VSVPIVDGGIRVGQFKLVGGISDLRPQLLATAAFTMAGGVFALAIGVIVAWRFQRRITRPLRSLLDAMAQVRQEHCYDVTVQQAADREIGELVDGFNSMLGDVRERDARLEAHARNLEDEVLARTDDLRVARDAAESANRAKSDFLATMSHEIRTPMNGIMVMAELLAQADLPRRQQRFADVIAKSGKSLLAIINDILDLSKIEAGKLELEQLPVDINALAENVTSLFAERAREKNLDLAAVVDPNVPRSIVSDSVRLGQIISNLVNNALKFTERGFVKLSIKTLPHLGCLQIAVTDTGIGIPEDKLGTVFESFAQADQSTTRNFGGTGLGLTISQRLVHAFGGEIGVTSCPGKGSTFSVLIPIGKSENPSWPGLLLAKDEVKFCVIDVDGDATRSTISRYFSASGYTVLERDQSLTIGQCAAAAVICTDVEKIEAYLGFQGAVTPLLVGLCAQGDGESDRLLESGKVDACLTKPLLRSEIEEVLLRLSSGDRILQPITGPNRPKAVARLRPFRALVADDNAVNREVAFEALSQLQGSVVTVENGLAAVEAVTSNDFDIVFMDGSMPVMDGFEATRRIRAAEAGGSRRTPIVALTAHVVGTAADEWRSAGMDDIVHKPFTVTRLAQIIEKLLPHLVKSPGEETELDAPVVAAPEDRATLLDATILSQLRQLQDNGQAGFVKKVLGLYVEHATAGVDQIRCAVESADIGGCARAAHALKSMSYNIGAVDMASLAADIENTGKMLGRVPDEKQLAKLLRTLQATLEAISQQVEFIDDAPLAPNATRRQPRDDMEHALAHAIERNELSVQYQPIVDRSGTQTASVEALLRWEHDGKSISPADFIPVAERSGSIHDIGEWVLRKACLDARAWPTIALSVNVSAVQFTAPDLADRIERVIAEVGFDWKRLQLEITETALLNTEEAVLGVMRQLKRNGASFALDDFGTGYSSLTSLRRFPFDTIKIDQSFIADVCLTVNATIVHAITSIGRALGLKVVAEGVENAEQQQFLIAAGVHRLQGYLFGRPAPVEAITERLRLEQATFRMAATRY